MTVFADTDHVVSMDEIDDYFETRGRWTGDRFELASTAAKRATIWRARIAEWAMRAGWVSLLLTAVPPSLIVVALGISMLAGMMPSHFPHWLIDLLAQYDHSAGGFTFAGFAMFITPIVFWTIALVTRRRFGQIRIRYEESFDADRVEFVEPLIAGGLLGSPAALLSHDTAVPEPFCVPVLTVGEDLPEESSPQERYLICAAAQCLLIESACQWPIDVGMVRFRNRDVSFLMTDFARERTEEILGEIRRLQIRN